MQPNTLYKLIQLWQEIHENNQKPTIFISQKFTEDQEDKIDETLSCCPPSERNINYCILYSVDQTVYKYKSIPPENTTNFQLKPPVKSLFQHSC